jgi:hypothetical protein
MKQQAITYTTKVKFSLFTPRRRIGETEEYRHPFLTSALDGVSGKIHDPAASHHHSTSGEIMAISVEWVAGWDPRVGLEKSLLYVTGFEPRVVHPVD